MHETARILRSALVAIMAGTLLAASLPCASVCAAIPAADPSDQTQSASSHCAENAPTEHPAPPCDDDCAGCAVSQVSIPSTGATLDVSPGHGFVAALGRLVSTEVGEGASAPPGRRFVENVTAGICLAPAQGYVFVTFVYRDEGGGLRNGLIRFSAEPETFSLVAREQIDLSRLFRSDPSYESHQIGPCQ